MITSEHLVTLLAIVPKYSQKDWMSSYESLDTFVVMLIFVVRFKILLFSLFYNILNGYIFILTFT
jgi:hypothetical protein